MTKKSEQESQEFRERKSLAELDKEISTMKHEMKMEELKFQRESDRMHHEREMERQRIKSAEIKKTLWHKAEMRR